MNTKAFFVVLILIGLIISLTGCTTAPPILPGTPPVDNTPAANEPPQQEPVETEPAPAKIELTQDVKDILAKNAKITSYEYIFQTTESAKFTAQHYVKGDKLRISYTSLQRFNNFAYYDIYLDKATGLAYIVCGKLPECKTINGKEVMFDQFNVETALEAAKYIDNGQKIEDTEWDNKKAIVVSYINKDSDDEKVWLWTYRGLPLKREITRGDTKITISYSKIVVDPIEPTSVELPSNLELV